MGCTIDWVASRVEKLSKQLHDKVVASDFMEGMLIAEVVSDGAVIELVAAGKAPDSTIESDVPGSASFDGYIVDTAMPEGLTAAT